MGQIIAAVVITLVFGVIYNAVAHRRAIKRAKKAQAQRNWPEQGGWPPNQNGPSR